MVFLKSMLMFKKMINKIKNYYARKVAHKNTNFKVINNNMDNKFFENGPFINIDNIEYVAPRKLGTITSDNSKEIMKKYSFKKSQILEIRVKSHQIMIERQNKILKSLYILSLIFDKGVNINRVQVSRKTVNAKILAKAIAYLCQNFKFNRVIKIIQKCVPIMKSSTMLNNIVGLKVTVNGRLKIGRITPRKTKSSFIIGRFKDFQHFTDMRAKAIDSNHNSNFNSGASYGTSRSNIEVRRVVSKNFKGQYSVTVKLCIILLKSCEISVLFPVSIPINQIVVK